MYRLLLYLLDMTRKVVEKANNQIFEPQMK